MTVQPLWLIIGAYLATCVAADGGDDFSNNLFSDLAPLLALFGERVTTQFMSQSIGWADNIILAMAPLGILTVIVSAIRVGGPSWLKAVIGRARENRTVAESELMSSTSHEVCELWNGQHIVRVMGSGPIREFIVLLPKGGRANAQVIGPTPMSTSTSTNEAERDSTRSQTTDSEMDLETSVISLERAKSETYLGAPYLTDRKPTFRERIFGTLTKQHPVPLTTEVLEGKKPSLLPPLKSTIRDTIFGKRIPPPRDQDFERGPPDLSTPQTQVSPQTQVPNDPGVEKREGTQLDSIKRDTNRPPVIVIRNTGVHAPNLALNAHNPVGRGELYIVAVCGVILQLGVIVYAGIAAKYLTLILLKDEHPIADYAFPCTVAGMFLLMSGILICAYVVESSTTETTYQSADGMEARVVWLQRSGTVNDQAFESFAVFPVDPQVLVTTSQRAPRRKLGDLWPAKVVRGVAKKLRGPTSQPGRTKKPKETTPQQPQKTVPGQPKRRTSEDILEIEIEVVIATTGATVGICGFIAQFIGLRGMHWSVSVAQLGAVIIMTLLRAWVRRGLAKPPSSERLASGFELDWFAMVLGDLDRAPWQDISDCDEEVARDWRIVTGGSRGGYKRLRPLTDVAVPEQHTRTTENGAPGRTEMTEDGAPGHRHSETGNSKAHAVMMTRRDLGQLADWQGLASAEAASLARAIEITMDVLFGDSLTGNFTWSLRARYAQSGVQPVNFRLSQNNGTWEAFPDEIEAALSLWLYSASKQEQDQHRQHQEKEVSSEDAQSPKVEAWIRGKGSPAKRSLRLLGPNTPGLRRDIAWWMPPEAAGVIEVEEDDNGNLKVDNHRIIGCGSGSVDAPQTPDDPTSRNRDGPTQFKRRELENLRFDLVGETGDGGESYALLATESHDPLKLLYAQDIFVAFMWAAAQTLRHPIKDGADIRPDENASSNNSWQSFTLRNARLSNMAQDIQRTGLGSLDQIYMCIIPPLSVLHRLPQVDAVIELARKHARRHEQLQHWKDAGDAYLWLFRASKTFPGGSRISTRATAVLMEYLRVLARAIELKDAHYNDGVKEDLALKSTIEDELRTVDGRVLSLFMSLYEVQHRPWTCVPEQDVRTGWMPHLPDTHYPKTFRFTELHRRATYDRWATLKRGVVKKEHMNAKDILDWTPLHYAVLAPKGDLSPARELLDQRADVNVRDLIEWTPLHYACLHRKIPMVQHLLREGADIDARGRDGVSPLHCAAVSGDLDMVRVLIEAGANIDIQDATGNTPLLWAAFRGRKTIVAYLWQDANKKLRGHYGRTALHLAVRGASLKVVRLIIDNLRADKDDREAKEAKDRMGQTPLHLAAEYGREDCVRLLVEEVGADKEAKNHIGLTPLHVAAVKGLSDIVGLLVELGADAGVGKVMDANGGTLLHRAVYHRSIEGVKLLNKLGADKEARNSRGQTPLHVAVLHNPAMYISLLARLGADVEAKDEAGQTPLQISVFHNLPEAIERLLEVGADEKARDYTGQTLLHTVASCNYPEAIRTLCNMGADKEARDVLGRTPLRVAAVESRIEAVRALCELGADPRTAYTDGWSDILKGSS